MIMINSILSQKNMIIIITQTKNHRRICPTNALGLSNSYR